MATSEKSITVEDIITLLKKHHSLSVIEQIERIPHGVAKRLLAKKFGPYSIGHICRELGIPRNKPNAIPKTNPNTKPSKITPSFITDRLPSREDIARVRRLSLEMEKKQKILRLHQLYNQHGVLTKAAQEMGISIGRASLLLKHGRAIGLFPDNKELNQTALIEKIESAVREWVNLKTVSEHIKISPHKILRCLSSKYKTDSYPQIKKMMGVVKNLAPTARANILRAKELYDELGTLEATAKALSITRERVRQLLTKGAERGLFDYSLSRDRRFDLLLRQISRVKIIETIKQFPSPSLAAPTLGIKVSELNRLMKHFAINWKDYRREATKKRYIDGYIKIVADLGYDPPTTDMLKKTEWRATWSGIRRLWGNMENFRKEFGIQANFSRRREHINRIRPKDWYKKSLERKMEQKKQRKAMLLTLIQNQNSISRKQIKTLTNWAANAIYRYLDEMVSDGAIEKIGTGKFIKYQIKK